MGTIAFSGVVPSASMELACSSVHISRGAAATMFAVVPS